MCERDCVAVAVWVDGRVPFACWWLSSSKKKIRKSIRQDPVKSRRPDLPDVSLSNRMSGSSFSQYLMQSQIKDNLRST